MMSLFRSAAAWLSRIPVADPVDRRNAAVIQALLLFLAITIPATMAFGLAVTWPALRGNVPWQMVVSISFSLGIAVVAAVGVWKIRRGVFRPAVRAILAVFLLMLAVNAAANGLQRQLPDQLAQMIVLILSGLVLGRRSLWIAMALLLGIVATGALRDALVTFADAPVRALYNVPSTLFSYLLVAVLIDRTTQALRESLRDANQRRAALEAEILERERTHAQLIHAQKKEITEQMASGMAHDFNNIFAVITGFTAQRHDDDGEPDRVRLRQLEDSLEAVEASARRGLAISRRLLRFSRSDAPSVETFDALDAVQSLVPMIRQLLGPDIVLTVQGQGAPHAIVFDRPQFELMLLNIASNARDAIRGEGHFNISVDATAEGVVIALRDDGHGMPPEVVQRAFEPFFSTKPADSGTGLGLAVVAELVRNAGGGIHAVSPPGEGTCIVMRLPHALSP